jgi:glycosyltransferase involved in cell wall biosynthesis
MNSNRGITVIICTWNRSASLQTTLQSLNEQKYCDDLDIEVIVVDNNSTDNTKSVVENLADSWKLGALRYAFEPKQGKQFALNHGIQLSIKPILAFTDDDILFPKDWIKNIAEAFEDPSLELTGGKTQIIWPKSEKPNWYHHTMAAILGGVDLGDHQLKPPPVSYAPAGGNLVARRTLFDHVGYFSESHFRHMDYEFGMRCANAGINSAYEPSLVVYAPVDKACLTKRYFRRWSFKAGIVPDDRNNNPSVATFLFAPRWLYSQLIKDFVFLISRFLKTDDPTVFSRELRLWRTLGSITSRWYAKWRPNDYSKWVKRYSQKNKDLY